MLVSIAKIQEKFCEVRPTVIDGWPDAHFSVLKVNQQTFFIHGAFETKEEAEWMCLRLSIAIFNIVDSILEEAQNEV